MDITIDGDTAHIEPLTSHRVEITVGNADAGSILSEIDAQEAVNHYGANTLLDLIGEDEAISYFGIEVKE